MRNPRQRLADLRAQQSANRVGRLRLAELAERHGTAGLQEGMAAILDYAERRTRAALAALPDGTYSAEDFLEDDSPDGDRARRRPPGHRDGRRRDPAPRLRRHRPSGRRQPQLPALGDQIGRVLRRPRPHRPRRPALRRRPPPDRGHRPARLPAERRAPRRGRRRQRRDLEPGRRPGDRGARRRPPGPRPGPGHDEQPDPGGRGLHLLRDARRRPGRLPRRRRPERRSTWRCRTR